MSASSLLLSRSARERSAPHLNHTWRPRIENVVPIVRWAILVRHHPRLIKEQTRLIHAEVRGAWPKWRELYRAAIAERAGVPMESVELDSRHDVRFRIDGKTPMIDLPELSVSGHSTYPFNLRNCAALCIHDFSSKIWTRVGPYDLQQGCKATDLAATLEAYRSLAKTSGEWFHGEFDRMAAPIVPDHVASGEGVLEVTTVGLQVDDEDAAEADIDSWLLDPSGAPNFRNEDFCRFMREAAALPYDVWEVESHEPNAFWMSIPMAIRLANGDLASRTALYLVRPIGDVIQAVGLGLDDSAAGDFASEVALKVSRAVANRI